MFTSTYINHAHRVRTKEGKGYSAGFSFLICLPNGNLDGLVTYDAPTIATCVAYVS